MFLLGAALLLVGCNTSSPSPFAGRWTSQDLPREVREAHDRGVVEAEVATRDENTFVFTLRDADGMVMIKGVGAWEQTGSVQATFDKTWVSRRKVRGKAHVTEDDRLLVTTEQGTAIEFERAAENGE